MLSDELIHLPDKPAGVYASMGGWSKKKNNWLKPGPVQVFCVWLLFLIFPAAAGFAGETGSGGWTTGNLLGFLIQVGIFILAAAGIRRLADGGGGEG